MDLVSLEKKNIVLNISKDEFGNFGNALNEVCNGFKVLNFSSRIGINKEEADFFLDSIVQIFNFLRNEQVPNEFDMFGVINLISVKNENLMISLPINYFISLNNALKIVSEEIEEWEIPIRMGATLDEINSLLKNSSDIIKKIVVNEQ